MKNEKELINLVKSYARDMRILIADDSRTMQELNKRAFGNYFSVCDVVSNGLEAYELWEKDENYYDLIVTDVVMPKMDGLELVQKIREKSFEQSIVIVTSSKDLSTNQELSLYYVDGILPKPMDPDKLYILLFRVLQRISDKKDMKAYYCSVDNMQFDTQMNKSYIEKVMELLSKEDSLNAKESIAILKKLYINTNKDLNSLKEQTLSDSKTSISNDLHQLIRRSSALSDVSALEYAETLDDTIIDKVENFDNILNELSESIYEFENSSSRNLGNVVSKLNSFLLTIESLGVFAILSRSFVELIATLENITADVLNDSNKSPILVSALLNIEQDLNNWVQSVFIDKSALNIHYFDASFANTCLEIESLLNGVEFDVEDDGLEFF
jgi:DNA-binding response OmpR family regulator